MGALGNSHAHTLHDTTLHSSCAFLNSETDSPFVFLLYILWRGREICSTPCVIYCAIHIALVTKVVVIGINLATVPVVTVIIERDLIRTILHVINPIQGPNPHLKVPIDIHRIVITFLLRELQEALPLFVLLLKSQLQSLLCGKVNPNTIENHINLLKDLEKKPPLLKQ